MEKKTNKLPEIIALDERFEDIFGVHFLKYIDDQLVRQGYGAHLDVVKFDKYLKGKYDDYADGISMDEFISMKFGMDAKQFMEELI